MAKLARGVPIYALLAGPAALVAYYSFNAGGYFPRPVAYATIVLAQVLVFVVLLDANPFARLSWPAVVAVAALSLFALWILASQLWSHAPARSLLEFGRALMYLLVLVICTLVGGA